LTWPRRPGPISIGFRIFTASCLEKRPAQRRGRRGPECRRYIGLAQERLQRRGDPVFSGARADARYDLWSRPGRYCGDAVSAHGTGHRPDTPEPGAASGYFHRSFGGGSITSACPVPCRKIWRASSSANSERYQLMKWATSTLSHVRAHRPDTGIMHTLNLERLASVIASEERDGVLWAMPDT